MANPSYVFLFNKECLKEHGFDQEEQDNHAAFDDDILLYSTINPKKLGQKLKTHLLQHPNSSIVMYIITDSLMDSQDRVVIFPFADDKMVNIYKFVEMCLNEVYKDDDERYNGNLELFVYCVAVKTPYDEGHVPENEYASFTDEASVLQRTVNDTFKNRGLKKLYIETHFIEYDKDRTKEATNELMTLKNTIMLKKDKKSVAITDSHFVKNNEVISTNTLDAITQTREDDQ